MLTLAFLLLAQQLSPEEITKMNTIAEISRLNKELSEAKVTIYQQEQQMIIMRACWRNNIPEKECSPQPNGELRKSVENKKSQPK